MKKGILIFIFVSLLLSVSTAGFSEEKYHIKEMTSSVKAALENRRSRFDELRQLKEKGIIGENNRGYVELLTSDASAKSLIDAENKDRAFIYKTIVEQNNLPSDALPTVESVFAQSHREKAQTGEKIQQANGEWATK